MHWLRILRGGSLAATMALGLVAGLPCDGNAGPREQAKRIHDRIVGVPPSAAVLTSMEASITGGDPIAAHRDVGPAPGGTRPVVESRALNHEFVHGHGVSPLSNQASPVPSPAGAARMLPPELRMPVIGCAP